MKNDFVSFDKKGPSITVKFSNKKNLVIGKDDVEITPFSKGSGGQNVNRNMNGVRLSYAIPDAYLIPSKKTRELVTRSIAHRQRERNLTEAFQQLAHKVRQYFYIPPRRKKTKVPKRSKKKRLENKKRRGQLKALRKSPKVDL